MPSTYTTSLRTEQQATGENSSTWGTKANAVFQQLEDAIAGVVSVAMGDANTTLTTNNGSTDEARNMTIVATGSHTAVRDLIIPGVEKYYVVRNATTGGFAIYVRVSAQTGVYVAPGKTAAMYCDGTTTYEIDPAGGTEITVASAATCDILGAACQRVAISGTTTITSLGTGANRVRFVRFTGALTLTHNATTLILPGGVNITTAAGDTMIVVSDNSSNARVIHYQQNLSITNTPIGAVIPYAGSTAPSGWLLCYGQEVSRTTYAALFAVISTNYGVGDGSTTFNVPDLRGRVAAGKDDMGGSAASRLTNTGTGASDVDGDTLGAAGGSDRHQLTTAQMPSHAHETLSRITVRAAAAGSLNLLEYFSTGDIDTETTGGGEAHPNVQPTIVLNQIIYAGA